jgi:hypothetical protein
VKILGGWHYLYRGVDQSGQVLDAGYRRRVTWQQREVERVMLMQVTAGLFAPPPGFRQRPIEVL